MGNDAGSIARPPVEGDPGPFIVANDQNGAPAYSHADLVTGRPIVLLFGAVAEGEAARRCLCTFRDRAADFAALETTIFAISGADLDDARRLHAALDLPFTLLMDATGSIGQAYGRASGGAPQPIVAIVLDPAHRIARILGDGPGGGVADFAIAYIRRHFPRRAERLAAHPPVLVRPRALSEDDCRRLIEIWHRPAKEWPAEGFASRGHTADPNDFKVLHRGAYGNMIELVLRDASTVRFLDSCLQRRVNPEIRTAFQTSVSRRENYRIVRYDATAGGVVRPHRDNPTKETAHRRFTMTVNLNAGDYEGGALRFREYGEQLYDVERGTAVVWSASLLHEVTPITRGYRFVLGVHMFST